MVSIVPPAADTYGTVSASVFVHSIKPMLQLVDLLLSLPSAPFSYQMMQKKHEAARSNHRKTSHIHSNRRKKTKPAPA